MKVLVSLSVNYLRCTVEKAAVNNNDKDTSFLINFHCLHCVRQDQLTPLLLDITTFWKNYEILCCCVT